MTDRNNAPNRSRLLRLTLLMVSVCPLVAGCSDEQRLIALHAGLVVDGKPVPFGETVIGRTARLWEEAGTYVKQEGGAWMPAAAGLVAAPASSQKRYVTSPHAVLHADVAAADRGTTALPFGSEVMIADAVPGVPTGVALAMRGHIGLGFVRTREFSAAPPDAAALLANARAQLRAKDIGETRRFALAALAAAPKDPGARRLVGALRNAAGEAEGWRMWWAARPPDAPVDLPPLPPVTSTGAAFIVGSGVAVRSAPDTRAKKIGILDTGTPVEVKTLGDEAWVEIESASLDSEVAAAFIALADLHDGVAPWQGIASSTSTGAPLRGWVSRSLLSPVRPDVTTWKALGLKRVAAAEYDNAIVPLTRAWFLEPGDDVREALFRAAVETERYVLALSMLDPVQGHGRFSREVGSALEVERVRGCSGPRAAARARLEGAAAWMSPPEWINDADDWKKGRLTAPGDALCIVDEEQERSCDLQDAIEDIGMWAGLGCGVNDDSEEITPAQRTAHATYEKETRARFDRRARKFAEYSDAFGDWDAAVSKAFPGPAIVVRVHAMAPQPARTLVVYDYTWTVAGFCGDVDTAQRTNLQLRKVALPAMSPGQTLELWVAVQDLSAAWGAFVDDEKGSRVEDVRQALSKPSSGWDFRAVSEPFTRDVVESGRGLSSCALSFGCCGC